MVISAQLGLDKTINASYIGKFSLKDKGQIILIPSQYSLKFSLKYTTYDVDYPETYESELIESKETTTNPEEKCVFDLSNVNDDILKQAKCLFVYHSNNSYYWAYKLQVEYIEPVAQVKPLYPSGITVDNTQEITFKWEHISANNDNPYGYDLDYSYDQSKWNNLNSVPSVENYSPVPTEYTVLPNTFESGIVYWRIRTYNSSDIVSEWANTSFIARSTISAPKILSVSNSPKIKILWDSKEQVAFQVIANQYNSGTIFGTLNFYTIPYFFTDGESVEIKLRVKDKFGDWSAWSTISKTISNSESNSITLNSELENNAVKLNWQIDGESPYNAFFILRDGNPIAKIENKNSYTDYNSILKTKYIIMGVTNDGYYTFSNPVSADVIPKTAIIGILSDSVIWTQLLCKRGNLPEIITNSSEDIYYQYYSGRILPVAYNSKFKTKTKALDFTVYKKDADIIEKMVGQVIIYKDYAGNKIIGVVNNVETSSYANRPDIHIEITAIDYPEVIDYD